MTSITEKYGIQCPMLLCNTTDHFKEGSKYFKHWLCRCGSQDSGEYLLFSDEISIIKRESLFNNEICIACILHTRQNTKSHGVKSWVWTPPQKKKKLSYQLDMLSVTKKKSNLNTPQKFLKASDWLKCIEGPPSPGQQNLPRETPPQTRNVFYSMTVNVCLLRE